MKLVILGFLVLSSFSTFAADCNGCAKQIDSAAKKVAIKALGTKDIYISFADGIGSVPPKCTGEITYSKKVNRDEYAVISVDYDVKTCKIKKVKDVTL